MGACVDGACKQEAWGLDVGTVALSIMDCALMNDDDATEAAARISAAYAERRQNAYMLAHRIKVTLLGQAQRGDAEGEFYRRTGSYAPIEVTPTEVASIAGLGMESMFSAHPYTCQWCKGEWFDWNLYDQHFADMSIEDLTHPTTNPRVGA